MSMHSKDLMSIFRWQKNVANRNRALPASFRVVPFKSNVEGYNALPWH
jgi:hypothetical protein